MKKIILLLSVAALTFGCTKEGPAGPSGTNGTNGTNGNANVISTNNFSVTSSNWYAFGTGFTTDLSVSQISSSVVDDGAVLVYVQLGTEWISLPYTIGNESASVSFGVGSVSILYTKTDATQTVNPGSLNFRVIVIPSN